jgi:RHS repeat-associated protein
MFSSTKNSAPFWHPPKPNLGDIASHPFGSYPKPQVSDLVVLAAYPFGSYPKPQISDLVVLAVPFSIRDILSSVSKGVYGYGFNGKETDSETDLQDYGERIYNSSIAKFLSADPLIVKGKQYPWYSPYHFAGNMPICAIDLDGLEEKKVTHYLELQKDNSYLVKKTEVEIKIDINITIDGTKYATTDVYYIIDGITYAGESNYEAIVDGGLKPSAAYDYTQNEINGKFSDDWDYIGWKVWRLGDVLERDLNAPDNRQTIEDLEVLGVFLPKIMPKTSTRTNPGIQKGGGKNAKHKNQDARDAAKKQYEDYNKKYKDLQSKPNKSKQDKKDLESTKRQRDHFKKKMDDTGENHSQTKKGN